MNIGHYLLVSNMRFSPTIETKLQREAESDLLVMSYNILLPNHSNWWVFKYYRAEDRGEISSWAYRKQLLQQQIAAADPDVLALQECSPQTFHEDCDFLFECYDGVVHKKSKIACAAFWKKERFDCKEVRYRDRSIVCILEEKQTKKIIAFVSVHLNAGKQPKRRFQQVYAVTNQLFRESRRYDIDLFVIAGDFNASARQTAVRELLENGKVDSSFREEKYPEIEISSNTKRQQIGIFTDCYQFCEYPPSMMVLNTRERLMDEEGNYRKEFIAALRQIFDRCAENAFFTQQSIEKWAMIINQGLRGGEYRKAMALLEETAEKGFGFEVFRDICFGEVEAGKAWAIYADLQAFGIELPQQGALYSAFSLDRIWYHSSQYYCSAVQEVIPAEQQALSEQGIFPPHSGHPSDHFPLLVRFSLVEE